jgi:uncharacterized protein YbbC (DUF1343 family)/CubicO group peptidase (beta-lactamase class C family)
MAFGTAFCILSTPSPSVGQSSIAEGIRAASHHTVDHQHLADADRLIEDAVAHGACPGAVLLVGQGGDVVYRKAYGSRAVVPAREAMTADTIFDLASLSKPVGCAASIMILAERGQVRLDETVGTYLPAFAAGGKQRITVADLLLHRGGLPPDDPIEDFADGAAAGLRKILAAAPQWEPGSRFAYSDVGYIVLGELVQAVDGRPLDRFAHEEIFQPLGMTDTTYDPPASWRPRIAPTQERDGRPMRGEVHDPRSFALGGVAGHAGVFSTADDLGRFCRMILDGGRLDGRRILRAETIREMTRPRCLPDGTGLRCYGFDVATPYSPSPRGNRFEPGTTFGHTGFTGTMFWIDPLHDCYFILLTNAVHPDGKGSVIALRKKVSTVVAEALLGVDPATMPTTEPTSAPTTVPTSEPTTAPAHLPMTAPVSAPALVCASQPAGSSGVRCGIDIAKAGGFGILANQRVALVTNQTGVDHDGNRTIDLLFKAENVHLVEVLSPEHGIAGVLDRKVADDVDARTGLKVRSLYGSTNRPTDDMLAGIDTIVFDVQDAGARYYTYISTMGLCMEAAAVHRADTGRQIRMVVLDRPNPATGLIVDGPISDEPSFTAYAPLPVAHGMTVGELARYFNTELKIGCDLTVVPMTGWRRSMMWEDTNLTWVNPSPNLRNPTAGLLYLGLGLLEMSNLSVGRGTDTPFELLGAPWIDGRRLAAALNATDLPGLRFVPISFRPDSSRFANQLCSGVRLIVVDRSAVEPVRAGLTIAWELKNLHGNAYEIAGVGKLLANKRALEALRSAADPTTLPAIWQQPLDEFKSRRAKYLMYPP